MNKKECKKIPQYRTVKLPINDETWNSFINLVDKRKQFKGGAIVSLIEQELARTNQSNKTSPI